MVLDQLTGKTEAEGARRTTDRVAVPATIFITPALSSVGITETQAREEGRVIKVAVQEVAKIKALPRPKAVDDPRGIIKFVMNASTDETLGARLFQVDS